MFTESEGETTIVELEACIRDGISDGRVRAIGECGLDYDRLHFCSKESQYMGFTKQLELSAKFQLPVFFHNRNTEGDFVRIVREHRDSIISSGGGVVHSFTGSLA